MLIDNLVLLQVILGPDNSYFDSYMESIMVNSERCVLCADFKTYNATWLCRNHLVEWIKLRRKYKKQFGG